ncbi:MAG: SIMPL domain-containing protein [Pseudomonadota bacterium]|nr:SIMPL domain-containing protein [Pseudomonadota bacterium]
MKNLLYAGFLPAIAMIVTVSLAAPSLAQMPPPPPMPPRSVTVSGEAEAQLPPDQAVLSLSLVSRDKNLSAAKQHNDALAKRLADIAAQLSIPKEKVATSTVTVMPEYGYDNGEQHFNGYAVSRTLRITMDNLDLPERLLSAVVEAKIDQVNGLEYRLAHPEAAAQSLRMKAFEDARAQAEALAQAAGDKLGKALHISTRMEEEGPMPPRPMPMMAMRAAAAPSVAPAMPGLIEVHESVTVTFALE